jgi:hypothetical protein
MGLVGLTTRSESNSSSPRLALTTPRRLILRPARYSVMTIRAPYNTGIAVNRNTANAANSDEIVNFVDAFDNTAVSTIEVL